MRTEGALVSGIGHGAVIALALFGLPWFSPGETPPVRVTEVSFVSEAEFAAAQSAAPGPRAPEAPPLAPAPRVEETPEVLPEPTPPPVADRPAPQAEPEQAGPPPSLAPSFNPEAPLAAAPEGVTIVAPATSTAVVLPPRPRPVERIAPEPTPAPPEVAQPAETVTPEQSDEPAPERLQAAAPEAPPEAAPETAPDPAPQEPTPPPAVTGLVASASPPPPRPARPAPTPPQPSEPQTPERQAVVEQAAVEPPAVEPPPVEPEPEEPSQADAVLERLRQQAAADAAPAPTVTETAPATSLPVGAPLTSGERDGLKLAIQRCWSVPAGLRDAQELRVTLAVTLQPDGSVIESSIRMIDPATPPDSRYDAAFRSARIALIRCAPYTQMPQDKFAQWQNLEIVFSPEGMVTW